MTEEAILKGCLQNDPAAQKELYNRYSPKMLSVCYRFAHNREDAEDMLQEGFIKIFSQMHTFGNRGAFEGWIRRIIVHTCINILKKNKKFNESVDINHLREQGKLGEREMIDRDQMTVGDVLTILSAAGKLQFQYPEEK